MSEQIEFSVYVFSPRWKRNDTYDIQLDHNKMNIKSVVGQATYSANEDGKPIWTGYSDKIGNPLVKILENDHIYPPSVFVRALESAWRAWVDSSLDDSQIKKEIQMLFEWLNVVSKNQPKSEFWISVF